MGWRACPACSRPWGCSVGRASEQLPPPRLPAPLDVQPTSHSGPLPSLDFFLACPHCGNSVRWLPTTALSAPIMRVVGRALQFAHDLWLGWGMGRGLHPRAVLHRGPIPKLTCCLHARDGVSLTGIPTPIEPHFKGDLTQTSVKAWGWGGHHGPDDRPHSS